MNKTTLLPLVAGLLLAGSAQAQDQAEPPQAQPATSCPQLPANAGLAWEARSTADSDFCRALRSDGSEAFGLYITAQPSFEPNPRNGKESGRIDGRSVVWYRAEIANRLTKRERGSIPRLRVRRRGGGRIFTPLSLQASTHARRFAQTYREVKHATLAYFAFHPNSTAHHPHQFGSNGQADSDTAKPPGR